MDQFRPERAEPPSPARRRACIDRVRGRFRVSERRACRVLGQHRSTQRKLPRRRTDEEQLVADMIELARQYGRYGYRQIAALLRDAGWQVNDKRVERMWRQREGMVPAHLSPVGIFVSLLSTIKSGASAIALRRLPGCSLTKSQDVTASDFEQTANLLGSTEARLLNDHRTEVHPRCLEEDAD